MKRLIPVLGASRATKAWLLALILPVLLLSGCPQEPTKTSSTPGDLLKLDPALDAIVPESAQLEKLADGFAFSEGPIWVHEGYLLFSDIPANTIFKWTSEEGVTLFRKPSGYDGTDWPEGAEVGSNGLTLDSEGRLTLAEHGNRRVTRLEEDGSVTVLADKYEGKRLNSPNDLVYRSDGALYFTDPPYGLVGQNEDPAKELEFNGVYRVAGDRLELLDRDLSHPNGIALSPDEKYLYVANSDPIRKIWMRYEVQPDGTVQNRTVFYDATSTTEEGLPDGLKVDKNGNVYATGPGGVWIFTPDGKHLGTLITPEPPANCHWGDADGKTLYITTGPALYRIRLNVEGVRP